MAILICMVIGAVVGFIIGFDNAPTFIGLDPMAARIGGAIGPAIIGGFIGVIVGGVISALGERRVINPTYKSCSDCRNQGTSGCTWHGHAGSGPCGRHDKR